MTVLRLWPRSFLGWGRHPDDLKASGTAILRLMPFVLVFYILLVIPLAAGMIGQPLTPERVHTFVAYALYTGGLCVLFLVTGILLPGVSRLVLARRGNTARIITVYGRCYAVRVLGTHAPKHCFVLVGLSRERASWFTLPFEWEEQIAPSDDQVEMEVLDATGWVARLRRLGSSPREMVAPPPSAEAPSTPGMTVNGASGDAQEDREYVGGERQSEATDEERREMRGFARHAGLAWHASIANLALIGGTAAAGGLFIVGAAIYLVHFLSVEYPAGAPAPIENEEIIISAVSLLLGTGCVVFGIRLLLALRRAWVSTRLEPLVVNGQVTAWTPYRDLFTHMTSSRHTGAHEDTLLTLREPDGTRRIFRVPIYYGQRVRRRGNWLQIVFVPSTERVLHVRRIAAPIAASRTRRR